LPKTPLHYLTYQKEPAEAIVNRALEAKVDGININFGLAEDELVNLAREKNLDVLVWTVNKAEMAKELAEKYRVDAITTDFPDLIENAVKEIGKSD
jgi:glycerophosphoryl diester phosphodiesterase